MKTPIYTVNNPELSRWMSAVEKYLKTENPDLAIGEIRALPMMQGGWNHVQLETNNQSPEKPESSNSSVDSIYVNTYASSYFLNLIRNIPKQTEFNSNIILSTVSVDDDDYADYIPESGKGMSILADNNYIRMAYRAHNDNHTISWAVFDISAGLWSGGLPIVTRNNSEKMNTCDYPVLAKGHHHSFMAFPGDSSTHIWRAIQRDK